MLAGTFIQHAVLAPSILREACCIPTGISIKIPVGYLEMASKGILAHVGLIDPGYRGEMQVILQADHQVKIKNGDRIAQLVIIRTPISTSGGSGDGTEPSQRGELPRKYRGITAPTTLQQLKELSNGHYDHHLWKTA